VQSAYAVILQLTRYINNLLMCLGRSTGPLVGWEGPSSEHIRVSA